LEVGAL
jgi:hypothetical protein